MVGEAYRIVLGKRGCSRNREVQVCSGSGSYGIFGNIKSHLYKEESALEGKILECGT